MFPPFAGLRPRRRAFSLIELLVVVGIIGVLITLLLPAIQTARESARRAHCMSNLKQIGIALNAHADIDRRYPVGCQGCQPNPEDSDAPLLYMSWVVPLLPHIEQKHLYDYYNHQVSSMAEENKTATGAVLTLFRCPTSLAWDRKSVLTAGDRNKNGAWDQGDGMAYGDYAGILGVNQPLDATAQSELTWPHVAPITQRGMLVYDEGIAVEDVIDGLSMTALVGESSGQSLLYQSEWASGWSIFDQRFDNPACGVNPADQGDDKELWSDHRGGAYLLFCDGHVMFMQKEADQAVLNAALTRAGQERVAIVNP